MLTAGANPRTMATVNREPWQSPAPAGALSFAWSCRCCAGSEQAGRGPVVPGGEPIGSPQARYSCWPGISVTSKNPPAAEGEVTVVARSALF
jgi:hypothetical protein